MTTDDTKNEEADESTAPLKFDLAFTEIPVTLTSAAGEDTEYVLRELSGKARDNYLTNLASRMKTNKEGNPAGIRTFDKLQANLLMRSLFRKDDDKAVSENDLQAFPSRVVSALFDKAKDISGLDEEADDKAKND